MWSRFFFLNLIWLLILLVSDEVIANQISVNVFLMEESSVELKVVGELLAQELNKNSEITARVKTLNKFDKDQGIYLSLREKSPGNIYDSQLTDYGPEGVSLYSNEKAKQVYLVGNSVLAVQHAAFFYLESLGYRYYFPHPAWHIIPSQVSLFKDLKVATEPDYQHRRIWYAYGAGSDKAKNDYKFWEKASNSESAYQVDAGHSYEKIINRNKKTFQENPEYYALTSGGSRTPGKNPKFCYSNKGLIELVTQDALRQFANASKNGKNLNMISLEPSDGGGHCTCDQCKQLGDISERVFFLANEVAREVKKEFPEKWIGLYAYNQHAAPPAFELEPNIFVMVATSFNKSSFTTDELVSLWSKKVKKLGIYDYYGVMSWDWDMPGQPRGSRIDYVKNSINSYYQKNAVALSAETNIGWISRGLGHYIASKLLWDGKADVNKFQGDFFEKSFGSAQKTMRKLYELMKKNSDIPPTSFAIAQYLNLVKEAEQHKVSKEERKRIQQIKYYLHYVVLYYEWSNLQNTESYSSLLNYAWRTKELGVFASYPLIRRIANSKAPSHAYRFDNKQAVWKSPSKIVDEAEIDKLIENDLKRYKQIEGIKVTDYGEKLIEIADAKREKVYEPNATVGTHYLILKIPENKGDQYAFKITSGFIRSNPPGGYVRVSEYDEATHLEGDVIFTKNIPEDRTSLSLNFDELLSPGTYMVKINDRRSGFRFETSKNYQYVFFADSENSINTWNRSNFYFFVPKETEKFLVISTVVGTLVSPKGRQISYNDQSKPTKTIEVKTGEHGVWKLIKQKGKFYFEGIPPYVSNSPQQLLVPKKLLIESSIK